MHVIKAVLILLVTNSVGAKIQLLDDLIRSGQFTLICDVIVESDHRRPSYNAFMSSKMRRIKSYHVLKSVSYPS